MEKDSKDQEERTSRNYGKQVMSVRPQQGVRAQEHMAGRGREKCLWCQPPTSSKAGPICSLGRMRRTFINRKKKEKSMLRKEGNENVLDLFVRVPSSVSSAQSCTLPWRLTQSIKSQMEERGKKASRVSIVTAQLFDGKE